MGHTCSNKQKVKRGLWSPDEDEKLFKYITSHGHGRWSLVPSLAGLQRNGRSCRLRWINYLRPDLKRGKFTSQEANLIVGLHRILGNRWAQIATYLPGRTDNCIKNFFYSKIRKKLLARAHSDLSSNHLVTTFPDHETTNIHIQLGDTSPNESPMATSQPHMINHDKCIDIDPTPDSPPLPQSFIVNSSSMFDNQFPTMEHLNSCDANILKPENYDLIFGQHLDHNPSIIPLKLGDQITNVDMTTNTVLQAINSHDLNPSKSSQTDLETFVQNIPSSSSSPPLVLPQFMVKKVPK